MENTPTVSSYLIQKLHEYGIKHIFGVPGDYILGFYDELIRSNMLKVVNTCDEQGAAFAADAYARVKGFGAVCITYCVGGLKVVNATAQAYAENCLSQLSVAHLEQKNVLRIRFFTMWSGNMTPNRRYLNI
jgi:TPP-dependent 2-oxoacid decarboxylase